MALLAARSWVVVACLARLFLSGALFTAVACGTLAPAPPPTVAPSHLRTLAPLLAVVTWNMNAGRGDLPRLVSDLESGQLAGAPPLHYVLLLQEATEEGDHPASAFASARGLSGFFVPIWHDGRVMRGNAILSTARLVNARAIELPRERQPRTAAAAAIAVGGEQLFVVSVHLENRVSWLKGGVLDEDARGRQADALLRALPAHGSGIVGGDLNLWLGAAEPAWRAFNRRFPSHAPDDRPTAPTFRQRLVLDHLFYDLPEGWHANRRTLPDRYGSDHHPVLVAITQDAGP